MTDLIDLSEFSDRDGFVVQFSGLPGLISLSTLVETLNGFNDSIQAISETVEPNFNVELYVSDVSPGSVRVGVRTKKTLKVATAAAATATMLTSLMPQPREIVTGLFVSYLYDTLKSDESCTVEISADVVTVKGKCDVRIKRHVYELQPSLKGNPKVAAGLKRAFQAVKDDQAVTGLGLSHKPTSKPEVVIERSTFDRVIERAGFDVVSGRLPGDNTIHGFAAIPETRVQVVNETRIQPTRTSLVVLKAWLVRGRRKWSFNWQGVKISAAIVDPDFFDQLEARSIALRQGDALDAELTITQRFLPEAKVWENASYSATKVFSVKIGHTQTTMELCRHFPLDRECPDRC